MKLLKILTGTSIGRKWVMAVTGIGAILFLVVHLGGNLLYYLGPDAYNAYAANLHAFPILPLMEAGLAILFVLHVVFAVLLTVKNRQSRGQSYLMDQGAGERNWSSYWMPLSGLLLLAYMVVHVWNMKFGKHSALVIFDRVTQVLSHPFFAAIYVAGSLAVVWHLYHGAASSLQSLGLRHPRYETCIKNGGRAFAILLALGFVSIPIYVFLTHG